MLLRASASWGSVRQSLSVTSSKARGGLNFSRCRRETSNKLRGSDSMLLISSMAPTKGIATRQPKSNVSSLASGSALSGQWSASQKPLPDAKCRKLQ